jgi:hypothetical protein
LNPSGLWLTLAYGGDPASAEKDLRRQRSTIVLTRHRKTVGAGVENRDVRRRRFGKNVFAEVVRAFAHRTDNAIGNAGFERCRERDDAMAGLIERRAQEIVHPRIDHEPAARYGERARCFRLNNPREQHSMSTDKCSPGLDVKREI